MDIDRILDRGTEDFIINLAILQRAAKDTAEEKVNEVEALAKLIAAELAQILGKIF